MLTRRARAAIALIACLAMTAVLAPPLALAAGKQRALRGTAPMRGMNVVLLSANPGGARPAVLGRARSRRGGAFVLRYRRQRSAAASSTCSPRRPGGAAEAGFPVPGDSYRLAAALGAGRVPRRATLNERTTVAMGFAMAQFIDGGRVAGKDPGLRNAAAMSGDLVRVGSGGLSRVLRRFPNGNSTSTLRTFDSLANLLGVCRAQGGAAPSLLRLAGAPGGGPAADTLAATSTSPATRGTTRGPLQSSRWRARARFKPALAPRRSARRLDPGAALRRRPARPGRSRQLRDRRRRRHLGRQQLRIQPPVDGSRPASAASSSASRRPARLLPGLALRKRRHQRGRLRDRDRPERTRLGRQLRLRRQGLPEGGAAQQRLRVPAERQGDLAGPGKGRPGTQRKGRNRRDLQGRLGSRRHQLAAGDGRRLREGTSGSPTAATTASPGSPAANPAQAVNTANRPAPAGSGVGFERPFGAAVNAEGDVFVTGNASNSVVKLSPAARCWSVRAAAGCTCRWAIAGDSNGYMWVSNSRWVVAPCPGKVEAMEERVGKGGGNVTLMKPNGQSPTTRSPARP